MNSKLALQQKIMISNAIKKKRLFLVQEEESHIVQNKKLHWAKTYG